MDGWMDGRTDRSTEAFTISPLLILKSVWMIKSRAQNSTLGALQAFLK